MGINKVQYGNTVLIDLTSDTVQADKLMQGYTAHDRTGALITGTATGGTPTLQTKTKTYTPTTSQQTESVTADSGYDGLDAVNVTVNAMPTGTAGTPAITVGALARGERKISASVTNTAGYIDDGTLDANSVYLSAAEFVTGSKTITENGTSDVTTYESVVVNVPSTQPTIQSLTVTPTTSQQTFNASGVDGYKPVTVNAMPSGTAGTPTATKGTVSNHSVSVTPSVTNTTGYITGSTKTGTAVTVSASELVSDTYTVDSSGTKDVTNYASASVPAGTAGTPSASKGAVSNHSVSVTPSVTNTAGYISGGTKNGTAVTVTASELASGNKAITENGTNIDVVGYSTVSVDVQGGGGYTWETLFDQNITIVTSSPNYFVFTFTDPLNADETYRVTWGTGGTQYICETVYTSASRVYDHYFLGNDGILGMGTDTGEPFVMYRDSATRMVGATNQSAGSWHIKVEKQVSTSATLIEKTITANGTYDAEDDDADGYSSVTVNVPSGSSKNTQVVQSTTRTNASTLTAIGAELTVSKTGTYDIYYSCFRTNTSSSYTWATRLYINGTAYGTAENATWTNNQQNTHLSNISLTTGDKLRVYGRNTRGTSYYVCAPMLAIVEA